MQSLLICLHSHGLQPLSSSIGIAVRLLFYLQWCHGLNKKFELMLMRCAKAYGNSCSKTVSLSQAISSQFILRVCAAGEDSKNQKPIILEVQGLSESLVLKWLKSSSLVLVVIGSMPMPICNHFHERLANNSKITTFTGLPLFDALVRRFPWT